MSADGTPCCAECAEDDANRAPGEIFGIERDTAHEWAWKRDQEMLAGNLRWLEAGRLT